MIAATFARAGVNHPRRPAPNAVPVTPAPTVEAMRAAVYDKHIIAGIGSAPYYRPFFAFVNDWGQAANSMWRSLGLEGNWRYVPYRPDDDARRDHVIHARSIHQPGYADHFVNDLGDGRYFDPWDGSRTRLVDDLPRQVGRQTRGLNFNK